jgi:hypothetical protein
VVRGWRAWRRLTFAPARTAIGTQEIERFDGTTANVALPRYGHVAYCGKHSVIRDYPDRIATCT